MPGNNGHDRNRPSGGRTREQDAERKRAQSLGRRIVDVPDCDDRQRRDRLEADLPAWLRYYFAHLFTYDFTPQQLEMVAALEHAMRFGGDQSIAASRGEGKTTLCECVLAWAVLSGVVKFPVLFCATGTDAENSLATFKEFFAGDDNERLAADYPEVCTPIEALENVPNRAHYMQVVGRRHDTGAEYGPIAAKFTWCGRLVRFPAVPGSPAAGSIVATRGLDAAVRGLKVGKQRPDCAIIDDPDTEETVHSEVQADKLEKKIERNIAGLAGQRRRIARVMLTTIQRTVCVSAKYTDPAEKPSWKGKRFRFLVEPPDRRDLWDEYIQLRSAEMERYAIGEIEDEHARKAHQFYLANRPAMDAGAVVANPNRYDPSELEDGTQVEVSALQRYYNLVADIGEEAVATEYDNNPPPDAGPVESGITAYRVQNQVSGYGRKQVPPGTVVITAGIDVRKIALHYVVRAWQHDGTGWTIDYGVHEVRGTIRGSDEGVDLAVRRAILERMQEWKDSPYQGPDGRPMRIRLALVDASWRTEAVYLACSEWGLGLMPAMGFGRSAGCAKPNFTEGTAQTQKRRSGDGWFLSLRDAKRSLWMVAMDADRWKAWEHDRWMTDPGNVGTMQLWGQRDRHGRQSEDQKGHFTYAKHITAEVEVEEVKDGRLTRSWKAKRDNNHYLDASYMSDVAANMMGVKLLRSIEQREQRKQPVAAKPTSGERAAVPNQAVPARPREYRGRPNRGRGPGGSPNRAW